VLLADREGTAVGVAHAGWRGLAAGVVERTVAALANLGVPTQRLVAWLGPSIGADTFEGGPEVRAAVVAHDPGAEQQFAPGTADKWYADRHRLAQQRLAGAGVRTVTSTGDRTGDSSRFYSWRRDRAGGRMAALVWIAPNDGS